MGKQWKQWQTLFLWAPKSLQMVTAAMKLKDTCFLEEKLWPTQTTFKKQRRYFANKDPSNQSYGFSSSHVWMTELFQIGKGPIGSQFGTSMNVRMLNYKESWAPKNWCFWTVVLEKTLESPLDCTEMQPVHPKGNQSWVFTGRTVLKLKLQYFGHLMQKTDSFEKTLTLGMIEGGRRRGWQSVR